MRKQSRKHLTQRLILSVVVGVLGLVLVSVAGAQGGDKLVGVGAVSSGGHWTVTEKGVVTARDGATHFGDAAALRLNKPVVGLAPTSSGNGYWLVAADGGIFAYGDAGFYGSMGSKKLNKPIVGIAPTATNGGYWMLASDGEIHRFGDAADHGRAHGASVGIVRFAPGYGVLLKSGTFLLFPEPAPGPSSSTTTTSTPVTTTTSPPTGLELALPRVPWEGGPGYWANYPKANAAGWTNPNFFPVSVFFSKADPTHVASLKDAGINTYMAVEYEPELFPITNITNEGMFALPGQDAFSYEEVADNPGVVGWFVSDECEMGYGGCSGDQYQLLAQQQVFVNKVRGYNDGRFLHANFGNGILRTHWSTATMNQHVQMMDSASADKYTYTSPHVAGIIDGWHEAPDWPRGMPVARAYSYGWQADQMKRFQDPAHARPIWTFIETARPYLMDEVGGRTIDPDEMEGAVWSALIHEARGIAYFQHNDDGRCNYSIVECADVHTKVKAVNEKVHALAPVLNTQSYYNATRTVNGFTYYHYTFANGTDTMLKTYGGHAYVFAGLGMGHATGSKTFLLPEGVGGTTVEVVGENRTLPVVGGQFTDSFAHEYTHHVYSVAL